MKRVLDLNEGRKARSEKSERFRDAAKDLVGLLERQRQHISHDFMAFLMAMATTDQALHYAETGQGRESGEKFLEQLFATARQLFDAHYQNEKPRRAPLKPEQSPRLIEFPDSSAEAE